MIQPVSITVQLATADDNGICESQTPLAGGNLTINGALASGGVATIATANTSRQVLITCAGSDAGRTFTIYGTDGAGNAFSSTMAGSASSTSVSTAHYRTVTRVAVDAATAGAVIVGTNGVGSSTFVNLDYNQNPFAVGVVCTVTGTVNFTVQGTDANIYSTGTYAPASYAWFDHADLTSKTANASGSYTIPFVATRLLLNSGSGAVVFNVIQATQSP